MNAYKSATPRAAFAFAAFAMTALTVVVSILVPANVDSGASRSTALALSSVRADATGVAASESSRMDVLVVNATSSSVKPGASTPVRCPDSA